RSDSSGRGYARTRPETPVPRRSRATVGTWATPALGLVLARSKSASPASKEGDDDGSLQVDVRRARGRRDSDLCGRGRRLSRVVDARLRQCAPGRRVRRRPRAGGRHAVPSSAPPRRRRPARFVAPSQRARAPRSGAVGGPGGRGAGPAAPPDASRSAQRPATIGTPARRGPLALTPRPRGSYNRGVTGERTILTYRDYAALPDDGRRYELHDGELSVTPAPGTRHQRVIGGMFGLFCPPLETP